MLLCEVLDANYLNVTVGHNYACEGHDFYSSACALYGRRHLALLMRLVCELGKEPLQLSLDDH